ncbi:hypothetical protein MMC09_004995 [Bachmanniomyces sp. S44760]|nr:hypothetical protein [Bachmanniomyces sp. S44760]
MRNFILSALLLTCALAAPIADVDDEDETCPTTVSSTVNCTDPVGSVAPISKSDDAVSNVTSGLTSGSNSNSTGMTIGGITILDSSAMSTNNANETGFPVNGTHVEAPQPTDTVPPSAATFTPTANGSLWTEFEDFYNEQRRLKNTTWLVFPAGVYKLNLDVEGDRIRINMGNGGFTFDFRGVTFLIARSRGKLNAHQFMYINQCEGTTILGGTFWFDQGEMWSQAVIQSIGNVDSSDKRSLVTYRVDDGYDLDAWRGANSNNQACVDARDPNHFLFPKCSFYASKVFDFSNLESNRTFTSRIYSGSGFEVGYHITTDVPGSDSAATLTTENNPGLIVRGLTSNGGFAQYGLPDSKATAVFKDVYTVNPPARPGYAPRVLGPTKASGHIGGFNFNPKGSHGIDFQNSFWQYTGCPKDLKTLGDTTLPNGSIYQK